MGGRRSRWGWSSGGATLLGVQSLLLPVKVVSDGPIYHLYFAARWWKAGRLFLVAGPVRRERGDLLPGRRRPLVHLADDVAGGATGWPRSARPRSCCAGRPGGLCGLARRLGAGTSGRVDRRVLVRDVTPLLLFTFEPNVDTIFVAGYLLAAYFFLRVRAGGRRHGHPGARVAWRPAVRWGPSRRGSSSSRSCSAWRPWPSSSSDGLDPARRSLRPGGRRCSRPLVMAGYWYGRNALLTGNPLYPLQVVGVWDGSGSRGGTAPRRCGGAATTIPVGDWRALADILLQVFDPRLAPVWVAALAGAWAWGRPRAAWRSLGLGVLGAGRAERGALLAGDPVPDPAAVHAPGGRAGGGSAGPAVRSRAGGSRWAAVGLLAAHLLVPRDLAVRRPGCAALGPLAEDPQRIPPADLVRDPRGPDDGAASPLGRTSLWRGSSCRSSAWPR